VGALYVFVFDVYSSSFFVVGRKKALLYIPLVSVFCYESRFAKGLLIPLICLQIHETNFKKCGFF